MKTPREGFRELANALKPMSCKERIEHLWDYYKWVGVAVLAVLAVISILVNAITARDPLFSGVTVNLMLTEEGTTYLTDDWKECLDGDEKDTVDLINLMTISDPAMMGQDAVAADMQLSGMIAAGQVDYVLMDKENLGSLVVQEAFADLRELLTQEQLDRLGNRVCYFADGANSIPVAVDITNTDLVQNTMTYLEAVYIGFPGNAGREELVDDFLEYLFSWEKPLQQTP